LLKPERTRVLAPIVVREAQGIPVEFHTHCNTGLGPLCALEAVKAGIDIINTAIPPLANGSSNPSVFNVAENLAALGYAPTVDLEVLRPVSVHFTQTARREGLPVGTPLEYEETHFTHQVPGGMISNLRHQLTQMRMLERLPEVLDEIVRVRCDFGYPIMVTPYSQFVGVQATLNVIAEERYKQLSDQMIHYALGFWGEAESAAMDPNLRDRILSSPRAKELAGWQPQELSLAQVREHFGGPAVSDDELLVRYLAGNDSVEAMRAAPPPSAQSLDARLPLIALIDGIAKKSRVSQIRIEKRGFQFQIGRAG
jgi:oxaloacetate decarboxylase alpha subunit